MLRQDLFNPLYDLISPDAKIVGFKYRSSGSCIAHIEIEKIPHTFVGLHIDKDRILFNLKSTLAQLAVESELLELDLSSHFQKAELLVSFRGLSPVGARLVDLLDIDCYVGKLFACDDRRRVRDAYYLQRMFGRCDREGNPLLSLGGPRGSEGLALEKIEGRTVAFLPLLSEAYHYEESVFGLLPTIAKGLKTSGFPLRELIRLEQREGGRKAVAPNECLLVRTFPLHVRTVFARVVQELLPPGYRHTAADVLQPDTFASGDIYELYGESDQDIRDIPLEFYTLEPYKEHVFFADRDQLRSALEIPDRLFEAFKTAPQPAHHKSATFIVKSEQLLNLHSNNWISIDAEKSEFPGLSHLERQAILVQQYIEEQPSYPFLKAMEENLITSQGILLTRYFPSSLMKRMLLSERVQRLLKGIYFQTPSRTHGEFFSHDDRSLLIDLVKFGIPVFWVDERTQSILQYIPRADKDTGMFVPLNKIETFVKATVIGIYGSNLIEGPFEEELTVLLRGLLDFQKESQHALLNPDKPLAVLTGGGPGAMLVGNKVAKSLGLLSCANIVDFSRKESFVNEQEQNPFIEAKMTYRLDKLVERQAEFHLDLPIILMGGIGSDFEFAIEEVRRKVASSQPTPVLLFGDHTYWGNKITSRFKQNLASGTIRGSEWVSNCFFCVRTGSEGLHVYKKFFSGQLPIGPTGPVYEEGFSIISGSF